MNLNHHIQEKGCHSASFGDKNQQRKNVVAAAYQMEVILKKRILSIVATLTMIIPMSIIGFAGLYGRVQANIPFDFMVGGKEFKAGGYSVDRVYTNNPDSALLLRSADNGRVINFAINNISDRGEARARLVFHRYGNQYFLAQIFDGQSGLGSALIKSKAEREAEKKRDNVTQNIDGPETVTVAAQIGQ
jgi:hypothetical protein